MMEPNSITNMPSIFTTKGKSAAKKADDAMKDSMSGDRTQDRSDLFVTPGRDLSERSETAQAGEGATQSAQPGRHHVDLTAGSDEDEEHDSGLINLRQTKICEPHAQLGKAVQLACLAKCRAAASGLARRTDTQGEEAYERCMGMITLLREAKTLARILKVMTKNVKAVLNEAETALAADHKMYEKFYRVMHHTPQKASFKQILDQQKSRVDGVKLARAFRENLIDDLGNLSEAFLGRKF